MTHHWTFNDPFPFKDHVTGQETHFIGTTQPLNNTDYLSLVGQSCLILGSFSDRCLRNMPACHSGYSLAFWLQITPTATAPQIFLGTSRNNVTDGVFVYQTETMRAERRVIVEILFDGRSWKVPLIIQQEIWDFVVLTWSITNHRLAAYMNGEMVNSTSVGSNESDVSKHVKLRGGSFPGQVERASLYLESGALYDHVITWNRSLTDYEVKRAFQSQMSEFRSLLL